jgi:hypothetical protein
MCCSLQVAIIFTTITGITGAIFFFGQLSLFSPIEDVEDD